MNARRFAECILTLGLRFRFSVTSWGRSAKHNQAEGGLAGSFHLDFRAVDVLLDPMTDKASLVIRAEQMGLLVVDEGDHLHIQPRF